MLGWKSNTKAGALKEILKGGTAMFTIAKEEAKIAGRLLACTLALRVPFLTQSVSLVGHSLGCQVIKSCLKELHTFGTHDLIENVTFLAGAASRFDKDDRAKEYWARVFSAVVNGVIRNVYTKVDKILHFYRLCEHRDPIGHC